MICHFAKALLLNKKSRSFASKNMLQRYVENLNLLKQAA